MTARTVPLKYYCAGPPEYGLNIPAGEYSDDGVRFLRTTDIGAQGGLAPGDGVYVPREATLEPRHRLRHGDLLFSRSGSLGRCLRFDASMGEATYAGYLVRLRPGPQADPRFLEYCAQSKPFQAAIEADAITSTISNFNAERYASIKVSYVPLTEQRAIADYLDAETARIDALIAKKQQLIHLLEERRESLAMDAISGGSTAGPRLASGLRWIGTIPANWQTPPIYARYDVLLGRMLNAERASTGDQRPYLRNVNVRWLDIDLADVATMDFPDGERERYLLSPGDLLICEGGAGYARAAVWDGRVAEMYFQKSLHRVRPRGMWPVRWLAEFLRAGKAAGAFEAGGNLATIPHLTAEQLRAYRIPMPLTPEEAQAILDHVDHQAENLAQAVASAERQLAFLAEHRQALITAAVVGRP